MIRPTFCLLAAGLLSAALLPSTASAQSWVLTYEAPGAGATTSTLSGGGVETFDARSPSASSFSSNFGGSSINGGYIDVRLGNSLPFGFGGSRHAEAMSSNYTLFLSQGVNYFGYYLAAADPGNLITFHSGSREVGRFEVGSMVIASVGNQPAYLQPIPQYGWIEPYAFVNFHLTGAGETFDRIVFARRQGGGHESDNHTVGNYLTIGGVTLVPEPASLALMLAGLAGIALAARRRG